VAVYNHYLSQAWRDREGVNLGRYHILMIGPTGVGKTHIVKVLAEFLQVPVGFVRATGLVEMGYKGNSVETILRTLLDRAGGDPKKAEKGIVFSDEIDEIKRGETGRRDVSGVGVQNALLTLLDGRTLAAGDTVLIAPFLLTAVVLLPSWSLHNEYCYRYFVPFLSGGLLLAYRALEEPIQR